MIVGVHTWGIVGAGVAHLFVALTVVLPTYLVVLNRQGVPISALIRAAAPPIGAAVVSAAVVWASSRSIDDAWHALVLGGSIGVLVYLALLHRWLRSRLNGSRLTGPKHAGQHRLTVRSPAGWQSGGPALPARADAVWRSRPPGAHRLVKDRRGRSRLAERASALAD
jgi:hypothetical protein